MSIHKVVLLLLIGAGFIGASMLLSVANHQWNLVFWKSLTLLSYSAFIVMVMSFSGLARKMKDVQKEASEIIAESLGLIKDLAEKAGGRVKITLNKDEIYKSKGFGEDKEGDKIGIA